MKAICLFLALCSLLPDTISQDAHLSLEQLLMEMERRYPVLQQYQYNMQSWEAKAEGATAWMPPVFSAGLMRFPFDFSTLDDRDDPMNQAGISFSLEQMIPNPGKLSAKKRYLSSLATIETSRRTWTLNVLRREAKLLYYNRYINERKIHLVREASEVLHLLLITAEAKLNNNQTDLQTIYKAKARIAELSNMLLMFQSEIAENNIGLNTLMVRDPFTPFTIDTVISPHYSDDFLPDTTNLALRSDILSVNRSIESMKLEQETMRVGNRLEFGLRASRDQMFGMPDQWSVMGMVTIPIVPWSNKMYTSETQSIGFQIESMELEKHTMELMAKRMISERYSMLLFETGQYENFNTVIIPAFERNLDANLLAYRQNTGDFFVLLDAWEMLLMKKMEMYDMLYNILKSETEYEYEREIQ